MPLTSPPANSWDLWLAVPCNPDLASLLEPKSGSPTRAAATREHVDEREHHPGGRARHGPPATGSDDVVGAIDTLLADMKDLMAAAYYGTSFQAVRAERTTASEVKSPRVAARTAKKPA